MVGKDVAKKKVINWLFFSRTRLKSPYIFHYRSGHICRYTVPYQIRRLGSPSQCLLHRFIHPARCRGTN
jgi:hypothetical protein